MTRVRAVLAIAALIAAGAAEQRIDWRAIATAGDRQRLREWRDAWSEALDAPGAREAAARDPALFAPDEALDRPLPAAGDYRCRLTRLGGVRPFEAPWGTCRVAQAGSLLRFAQIDGARRVAGSLYDGGRTRGIFLGTCSLAEEHRPIVYGHAAGRDVVGVIERIGERRWRLVLPSPPFGARLEIIELVQAD